MSRTVTAYFDTRDDAEAGRQRLISHGVDADNVRIHDQSSEGYSEDSYSSAEHGKTGMWGSVKNAMLPDEDRHTYEEGVRRGGAVLTADVDEDDVDDAVRALEDTNSIDIDDRSQSWRNEGWTGPATGAAMGAMGTDYDASSRPAMNMDRDTDRTTGDNQTLDVVEERLVVGKREVERGGVRVRSYVTETPVHEQVRLREENVNVERRPVDRRIDGTTDAFQDRTIELTERSEEAVVGKEARVVEEVVVSKTATERTEDVSDTVRRTDVDVEQIDGTTRQSGYTTDTDRTMNRTGESLGDKARGVVEDVKDGLGIGDNKSGTRGSGQY